MQQDALIGGFDNPPVMSARAFRGALDALARPGSIHRIEGASGPAPVSPAAASLLLTLCDAETPLHLAGAWDSPGLRDWVTFHCGAPLVGAADAMFALGDWPALCPMDQFAIGTPEYPDRSATLIIEMPQIVADGTRLRGPGIKDSAVLNLPDPTVVQRNAALFPLGLDFFFTSGSHIAALPRSSRLEEI